MDSRIVIRRKRVKWPTFQPRSGARWQRATMKEENEFQRSRYPTRFSDVWIGGVKFSRVIGWSSVGQGTDINWGWITPLYNMAIAMERMGYKDFVDNSSMHGDFRYVDINESVLNMIHIMFKDYKIPHLLDHKEGDDDDEEDSGPALPLIQQVQAFAIANNLAPVNNPSFPEPRSP